MTYQPSHHPAAPRHQPPRDADALDAFLLDDESKMGTDSKIGT